MATSPTCIIAYASEDGRYTRVTRAAMDIARAANASLIFYDIDAAAGPMDQVLHPLSGVAKPTAWDGEGAEDVAIPDEHRMTPEELERSGRGELATQVLSARSHGIKAFGWLPDKKGIDGLADYAHEQGADLIVLPSDLRHAGLGSRLRGEEAAVEKAVKKTAAAIALVGDDGTVEYPEVESEK